MGQPSRGKDNVKEFQDLFAMASSKFSTTTFKKQQVDYTYNPLGVVQPSQAQ